MSEKNVPNIRFKGFTEDWEQRKASNIFQIITDYVANGSFAALRKNVSYSEKKDFAIVVRLTDYSNGYNGPFLYTSEAGYKFLKKSSLVPGDILISNVGANAGLVYRTPNINVPMTLGPNSILVRTQTEDTEFLYQMMRSINGVHKIKMQIGISAQPKFNKTEFRQIEFSLPSKREQEKIGIVLNYFDQLIASNQRKLDQLKEVKKILMQKIFDQEWRFKGFADPWEQRKLGEHAIIKGRLGWKSLKQDEYTKTGPSMIAGKHIQNGIIDWQNVDHIPQWRYDESPEIMLRNNDIIFSKDGSLGNPALIKELKQKATINSTMMLVRLNDIDASFFYQVMVGPSFERLVYLKVSGSSIPHLFQADMTKFVFKTPGIDEQTDIGMLLNKIDALIASNQQKVNQLKKMKKWFMQNMFV
jgi:restriction endonuclease S subunit